MTAKKLVETQTGFSVLVPLFIKKGDSIAVNPETGEYLERKNLLPSQVRWSSLVNLVNQETRDYVARVRAGRYAISETS